MSPRRFTGPGAAVLAVVLGGCLLAEGDRAGEQPPAIPDDETPGAPGGTATVRLEGLAFDPAQVSIGVGGTVVFENFDPSVHLIREGSPENPGALFRKSLSAGQAFSVTFSEPGDYIFYCANHPQVMRDGRITVR